MDSIIINQLMYGIRGMDNAFTSGYVKSMETQERWGWHNEQLETFERNSFVDWVLKKIGMGVISFVCVMVFIIRYNWCFLIFFSPILHLVMFAQESC